MKKSNDKQYKKPGVSHPTPLPEVKDAKQTAEASEVAGRHKNDGQMGHKGAR
jgi:hypothetical protein